MTDSSRTFKMIASLLTAMTIMLLIAVIIVAINSGDDDLSSRDKTATSIARDNIIPEYDLWGTTGGTATAWKNALDATGTVVRQYNLTATAQSTPIPN